MKPSRHSDPGSDTTARRYSFRSRWHLGAPQQRVWALFEELLGSEEPLRWWPGMASERRGGPDIHVTAGTPVGYSLRFRLHDLVQTPQERVALRSDGDLEGTADVRLSPRDATSSAIDVVWDVDVTPPWMRLTGFALRPAFVLGHHAVMRAGERGLNSWLARDSDPVG